jgi:hypothetical protein
MNENEVRNEVKVMVLVDLAAICKKLAENPTVPEGLRANARRLTEEFDSLLPARGKGTPSEHAHGEALLAKMARFIPKILDIHSWPADSSSLM